MKFILFVFAFCAFIFGALLMLSSNAARGLNVEAAVAGLAALPILLIIVGWLRSLLRPRR